MQNATNNQEVAKFLDYSQGGTSRDLKIDDNPFDQNNKADDNDEFEDIRDGKLPKEEPSVGASKLPGLTDDDGTNDDKNPEEESIAGASLKMHSLTDGSSTSNDADDSLRESLSSPADDARAVPAPSSYFPLLHEISPFTIDTSALRPLRTILRILTAIPSLHSLRSGDATW